MNFLHSDFLPVNPFSGMRHLLNSLTRFVELFVRVQWTLLRVVIADKHLFRTLATRQISSS